MKVDEKDPKTVKAADLIVPSIGELVGGSEREDSLQLMSQRMTEEYKMDLKDYEWYLDLRRYGSVPHSGFGLGFERYIQFLTGIQNIRDCVPLPRHYGSCKF